MIPNLAPFKFHLIATDNGSRLGRISTAHGEIHTPAFMPVGTAGAVKALYPEQVKQAGADIILGNTYHLMLRPGAERIARLGGLHQFMQWPGPILTDSGGFQVMSLSSLRKITEQSVTFRSHIDGATFDLSPERSMEIQHLLGADIQMQLDECISLPNSDKEVERAMQLSLRWAERSRRAFQALPGRGVFGIVQGGLNLKLRQQSLEALAGMDFHGLAIGGLAVGESQAEMFEVLSFLSGLMPAEKPHYLMGVGTPQDILGAVERGLDMFDCVMPTRAGRHGQAFTRHGKLNLRNARFADDPRPIDSNSGCPATSRYSRAYIHHLLKANESLAGMLLSWVNISYYQDLMQGIRNSINQQSFTDFKKSVFEGWARGLDNQE